MNSEPCELLAWDSDFFGVRIARLVSDRPPNFEEVDVWCQRNAVRCAYYLADPTSYANTSGAEAAGFRYVDVRFTLRHDLDRSSWRAPTPQPSGHVVRSAEERDTQELVHAASTGFERTRFTHDPHFVQKRSREMYGAWVGRAMSSPDACIFIAEDGESLLGYCAVSAPLQGEAQILLAGVVGEHRGKGIGTQVVAAAIRWVVERKGRSLQVVTQGVNIPAQRLYASNGFYPVQLGLWFHKWYPSDC
jgi:ribosomal protein S18 acetylase RimI-like enzyme